MKWKGSLFFHFPLCASTLGTNIHSQWKGFFYFLAVRKSSGSLFRFSLSCKWQKRVKKQIYSRREWVLRRLPFAGASLTSSYSPMVHNVMTFLLPFNIFSWHFEWGRNGKCMKSAKNKKKMAGKRFLPRKLICTLEEAWKSFRYG